MLVVGLTGNIASGKSTVAQLLSERGATIIDADVLARRAVEAGCLLSIDSDAHAPGQLDWLPYGCERAAACGVPAERVVNTWPADDLRVWAANHGATR